MKDNSYSIHYSVKDNGNKAILNQGTITVPKEKGVKKIILNFQEYLKSIFGGRHD